MTMEVWLLLFSDFYVLVNIANLHGAFCLDPLIFLLSDIFFEIFDDENILLHRGASNPVVRTCMFFRFIFPLKIRVVT